MRRNRVPSRIKEVSIELNKYIETLKTSKIKISNDVEKIYEYYKGTDSLEIIQKFKNYINDLNEIINNYSYWVNYLTMMTDYDLKNIDDTISNFSNIDYKDESIDIFNIKIEGEVDHEI